MCNSKTSNKKQGTGTMKSNYYLVSNLSFLSKVNEKCVKEQFSEHSVVVMKNSEYQSEYKEGHSCETALINPYAYTGISCMCSVNSARYLNALQIN